MRNLRMLILDDQAKRLDRRYIDQVECITVMGQPTDRLSNWTQHLRWYIDDDVPEFDLLLVDVSFDKDTTAPYSSNWFNPYGLLHALPLAARQHNSRMPFAWVIGTHKRSDMRDNHVAVFAYGLLRAMENRVDPKVLLSGTHEHFQERIDKLEGLEDQRVFVMLMQRYREQLKAAAEHRRIEFDFDELTEYAQCARRGDRASIVRILDSGLTVYYQYQMDTLSLRSIFADYSRSNDVDPEFVEAVKSYLDDLKALAANGDIFPSVKGTIEGLKNDPRSKLGNFVNNSDPQATVIKVGVIVCLWLDEYVRVGGGAVPVKNIMEIAGLQYNELQQILTRFYGSHEKLKSYLRRLSVVPLEPPSLFNCAAEYWRRLRKPTNLPLPACLQQPEDDALAQGSC